MVVGVGHRPAAAPLANVLRRFPAGVDPSPPRALELGGHRRNLESQRLPVGIEHPMQEPLHTRARAVAARLWECGLQSGPSSFTPCQCRRVSSRNSVSVASRSAVSRSGSKAAGQEQLHEPPQSRVLLHQGPVEPTDLVVLAIGVVVALLRPADFVSGQQHRRADGQQIEGQEVLDLAIRGAARSPGRRSALPPRSSNCSCRWRRPGSARHWPRCASRCTTPGH